MNDFSELEAELKQLRPIMPSTELVARVERALEEGPTPTAGVLPRRRARLNWFAVGFGLTAAAAAFFMLARVNIDRHPQDKTSRTASIVAPPAAPDFQPDGMTRVVYGTSNDGLVYPKIFNEPARRVVSHSRETFQWKDAKSGASLRVSYPTEEVELIPVSLSGI